MPHSPPILVTGATGYVGGRLVGRLLEAGHRVRVMVRDAARLQGRPWLGQVEVAQADTLKPETLAAALCGVEVAYYLVHSMAGNANFYGRDLFSAHNFGLAAQAAGVRRIIYLGGLGNPSDLLSDHLLSRQRSGDMLRESGVPVTEFRAAVVVGSGSASFEMIRYLVERLPVLLCPAWTATRVQPIAIRNVLEYLVAALDTPDSTGQIIQIGGADVLTYSDMMLAYAEERRLHRARLNLPALPFDLCAQAVYWLTPIPLPLARSLISGMQNEVVVRDGSAPRLFPQVEPFDYRTAVRRALVRVDTGQVETTWSDALVTTQGDVPPYVLTTREGMIIEQRQRTVAAPARTVYRVFTGLGGDRGWLYMNWLWVLRGVFDRAAGGVGFRRGRRSPDQLRVGDTLDFWRVETLRPGKLMRLRAEMKAPGPAWLEMEAQPARDGRTRLVQTAIFAPRGVLGLLYWYALYPFHALLFAGLIRKLAEHAEKAAPGAV